MARQGEFSRGGVSYGVPLSYVHPQDNKMPPQWDPDFDDVTLALTEAEKIELQDRADDLTDVLRGEGRYY